MLTYDKKLSELRVKFGDYSQCLVMLLSDMPELGGGIPLTERITATQLNPAKEIDATAILLTKVRGGEHFATVDGVEWFGFDLDYGVFFIHNNDDKFYYLTIN
jgi:hypothetical protein